MKCPPTKNIAAEQMVLMKTEKEIREIIDDINRQLNELVVKHVHKNTLPWHNDNLRTKNHFSLSCVDWRTSTEIERTVGIGELYPIWYGGRQKTVTCWNDSVVRFAIDKQTGACSGRIILCQKSNGRERRRWRQWRWSRQINRKRFHRECCFCCVMCFRNGYFSRCIMAINSLGTLRILVHFCYISIRWLIQAYTFLPSSASHG